MKRRKRKEIISSTSAHFFSKWVADYLKKNPTPKYSENRKPKGNLERIECMLEIAGPEKFFALVDWMEKNNIDSINWGEVYEYALSEEAKKKSGDNPPEK